MNAPVSPPTLLLLVLGLPLGGSLLLTVLPRRLGDRVAGWLGVLVSTATLGVVLAAAAQVDRGDPARAQLQTDLEWAPSLALRFHLGVDGISLPFLVLAALLVVCCCLYTVRVPPPAGRLRAFTALVLLLEVGMLGTFLALDLLLFFLFFEVVLVPMWFLVAWWGDEHDRSGRVAAATTFILYTLTGSAVMLVGFLLVGTSTGTLDLVELAARGGAGMDGRVQLLAALAIVGGLAVKVPLWPFHTWLPDAHAKAPTVGSVLLAGVLLKMGSYGLVRVALPVVPDGFARLAPWLAGLAVVGIVYGSLACLAQREIKRLVAYSSVGHMGFVVLGAATMTPVGVNASIYAGLAHGVITGLLFFLAGAVKDRHGTGDLATLGGGLYARAPRLGGLLAFAAVASLGLPGLAGFWGEMLALAAAFRPSPALARAYSLGLLAVAAAGVVLTAAYLLGLVRRVCQGPGERGTAGSAGPAGARLRDLTAHEALSWSPLVALTVVLGVWPGLVLALSDPAVRSLLGAGL